MKFIKVLNFNKKVFERKKIFYFCDSFSFYFFKFLAIIIRIFITMLCGNIAHASDIYILLYNLSTINLIILI